MIQLDIVGIAATGLTSGLMIGIICVYFIRRFRSVKKASNQFTTRFMYSGNLKQTNLLDAIQFLEIGRREGILHLYIGRRKGYVTFVGGQIVDAFYRNTTGKEAIFQMIDLNYGDFYFESKVINQPRVIKESIMDIALEWDARKYGDGSGGGQGAPGEVGWQEPGSAEAGEQNGNQGGDKQSEANQEQ
jgi:hypothetical protein